MIIPKLWARLGNQCFMISAAIAHAKRMSTKWAVPHQTLNPRLWPIYFRNIPTVGAMEIDLHKADTYIEKRHCFDALPENNHMIIQGYFQSEKYFEHAKPEIQMALNFFAQTDDYVAVHIRRGDYLQYPDQFPVLPMSYYLTAISHMLTLGYEKFRIYTDDVKWCKSFFGQNFQVIKFEYSEWNRNPVMDMRDMYNAKAFIIANSTFSLFPALLRPDNPVVIAPNESRWYGPKNKHLETYDLMPERFIKI